MAEPPRFTSAVTAAAPSIGCEITFKDVTFDRDEDGIQIELGHGTFGTATRLPFQRPTPYPPAQTSLPCTLSVSVRAPLVPCPHLRSVFLC